jgi:hypothetical protein
MAAQVERDRPAAKCAQSDGRPIPVAIGTAAAMQQHD